MKEAKWVKIYLASKPPRCHELAFMFQIFFRRACPRTPLVASRDWRSQTSSTLKSLTMALRSLNYWLSQSRWTQKIQENIFLEILKLYRIWANKLFIDLKSTQNCRTWYTKVFKAKGLSRVCYETFIANAKTSECLTILQHKEPQKFSYDTNIIYNSKGTIKDFNYK